MIEYYRMDTQNKNERSFSAQTDKSLRPYLSPLGAWALAFGCCVGWGAFVMPGTTFLPTAGPLGALIGMLIGAALMLIIAANYQSMTARFPDEGGAYTFVKNAFGYDHAYLCAWFLILTYVAILWANATAIVLIARNLLGDFFQKGFHYRVIGYDIWLGEVFVTIVAVVCCGLLCVYGKRLAVRLEIVMAIALFGGILISFFAALSGHTLRGMESQPLFFPAKNPIVEIVYIVALVPWAFVGFESISHSATEFTFPVKKTFRIMAFACVACGLSYALPATIAAFGFPEGYGQWTTYIARIGGLNGLEATPVLYAASRALGTYGRPALIAIILCATLTSLIGNYTAASRLLCAMAKDRIFPARYTSINRYGAPDKALFLVMGVSCLIPFLGRTAIGWIVDVTTIGATIVYGYASAAAYHCAKETNDRRMRVTGLAGVALSILFGVFLLAPDFLAAGSLATESYLIFTAWGLLGFIYFRVIFGRDRERRYGKSLVVWVAMLLVLLFSSLMWMRKATSAVVAKAVDNEKAYRTIFNALARNSLIQSALIVVSLLILLSIYAVMRERENRLEREKTLAEESNQAKSAFLSNMSHEIRTPINAVLGMNEMIIRETKDDKILSYARNVESAGNNLLSIINDILDFSKIEAGKMEIVDAPYQLSSVLNDVANMVSFRAKAKDLTLTIEVDETLPDQLYGDAVRVRQVVTNLLNNAVKYTNEGGVTFTVAGDRKDETSIDMIFKIKDTGIGIKEEDIGRLFDKFERMDLAQNSTVEGTGLGLSITKNLLALMQGEVTVESVYGEGSTFTARIPQGVVAWDAIGDFHEKFERYIHSLKSYRETFRAPDAHILVVDDTDMNLTVVEGLLEKTEIQIDTASGAALALELTAKNAYDLIFMDQRMPHMSGTEALCAIRKQTDGANTDTPVVCLTADAVSGAREKYLEEGFTDYLTKPIDGAAIEALLIQYLPAEKVELQTMDDAAQDDTDAIDNAVEAKSALQSFYEATDGLDYAEAVRLCANDAVLEKTLRQFFRAIAENADAIENFLQAGDYDNYRVKVHALKSSARLIGADALSDAALRLETCANDLTKETKKEIAETTPDLLALYRAYETRLAPYCAEEDVANDAPKETMTQAQFDELLDDLRAAVEEYDSDAIDALVSDAARFAIPDTERARFDKIRRCAENMDWEGLEQCLT